MFGRPKCPKCNERINKKYSYCPYCGTNLKKPQPQRLFEPSFKMGFPFNMLFKEIEKQFRELDSLDSSNLNDIIPKGTGISIKIDSSRGHPVIKVNTANEEKRQALEKEQKHSGIKKKKLTKEQAEKFASLPNEEPPTSVRRLTNKIIYEIELPGVKKENIIITRLQNSIEIKAITEDKAYFKLIPISLPIMGSKLKEGKLTLELKPSN